MDGWIRERIPDNVNTMKACGGHVHKKKEKHVSIRLVWCLMSAKLVLESYDPSSNFVVVLRQIGLRSLPDT